MQMYLTDGSIQTCVTSPPYFGLRDYGVDGQIGLESSVEEYVQALVAVFREVRRCLRDDGTLWLNLGDSYAGSGRGGDSGKSGLAGTTTSQDESKKGRAAQRGSQLAAGLHESARQAGNIGRAWVPPPPGLKHGDLIGVPWRVALALQADGWFLRQDIIWHKPNPMPESVRNRCTKAHEYIFLLSKKRKYYFDAKAIAEPLAESSKKRLMQDVASQEGSSRVPGKTNGKMKAVGPRFGGNKYGDDEREESRTKSGDVWEGAADGLRNKRSVWTVTTKPFKEAHFATFPQDLIEPCILAGSKPGDTVLDPFGGAGTTALVARKHGRASILCELNPEYVAIAEKRLG
ncbi:MAG: site-specific DNA-methyltransferase [Nocardiaceae bacterium]|nr:site-specific DNA-methyltransferase [Nocardiaceae bacterium]